MNFFLGPIDDAVAWVITHLFNALGPIFGATSGITWVLTIVVLVVLMRLILVPLFIKQMHTQRAMTALAPKISELRKKYKGDRERLNAETMKLYQEAGVNPLMGCLPVVLQMPIFFALFTVLRYIAEWKPVPKAPISYGLTRLTIESAQHAKIFGATIADKVLFTGTTFVPVSAKIVIVVTVVLSMATTYLTVRQGMKRGVMPTGSSPMGQSQKLMAYFMPLFALTGLYWQFGLVLYWVTTNVWTLGQQYVLLRKYPVAAAVAAVEDKLAGGKSAGGVAGKPATATGFTSGATRRKPSGGAAGKAAADTGKAAGKSTGGDGGPSANGKAGSADGTEPGKAAARRSGGGPSLSKSGAQGPPGGPSNGHKPGPGEGGMLRRLGRGKSAPEPPEPVEPETKIVRHQPQRQSRSKRSGKR